MIEGRVLVTGATGFVGRRLVQDLLDHGAGVRILNYGPLPIPDTWRNRVEIRDGDLTSPRSLDGLAAGIQTVFHLAGEIRRPDLFDAVNRRGTENLLEACQAEGVKRFLYMSSVGVMGAGPRAGIVDEQSPETPRNAYEKSKLGGERIALSYHTKGGVSVTVLRPSIIYGEGKDPAGDGFFSLLRSIRSGRFVLFGEKFISSYVYVGDVVAAALLLANHPRAGGEEFIVNEPVPLRDFIDEISANFGRGKVRALPTPLGALCARMISLTGRFGSLYNQTSFSMAKLRNIGFTPPFGYREGLKRTISAYGALLGG